MPNNNNGSIDFEARLRLDQLDRDLQRLRDKFSQTTQQATKDVERFQSTLNNAAKGALAFFTLQGAQSFAREIFNVRSQFQQLEISFTTMLKSKEKANALMGEMVDLAAKSPLGLRDISEGAKRLLAFKVPAEEVNETLRRMGDIASGLGVPIGQLIHVYGQVKAQGRLMTNDLYQFMNAGIPIIDELSKITGKTQSEIKEMVSQGKIGFTEIQQVIKNMTDSGGLFHNLMAEQSKTLGGQLSNLRDNVEGMLNELGKASEGAFSGAISGVNFLVEHYREIGKILSVLIATYGTYRTALMAQAVAQQVVTRYGQYDIVTKQLQMRATIQAMLAQIKLNTAMLANPYVLAGAAIAGLVVAIWQFSDGMSAAQKAQKKFNDSYREFSELAKKEKQDVDNLIETIKDENAVREKRIEAFDLLKSKYPEIFGKYKTEEELLKNLKTAYKDLNDEIDGKTNDKWEEKLKQAEKRILFAQERINNLSKNGGLINQLKIDGAKEDLQAAKIEADKIKKHLQYQTVLKFEAGFKDSSLENKKAQLKYVVEEMNLRKSGKKGFEAYSQFSDGNLGRLHQTLKNLIASEEEQNKIIHSRVQLLSEEKSIEKELNLLKQKNEKSTNDVKKIEELEGKLKSVRENLKNNYGVESSKKTPTSKTEKTTFDKETFDLQTQRQERDIELQEQHKSVEKMAEGYEKERALIQLHYDEKEEAILRGQQDALRALEKEYKDSKGLMSQSQYEARKSAINDMAKTSHDYNLQVQEKANNKLIESLLKSYQDFEDKKTEISEEYAQKRALLEETISKETDPKKIEQLKRSLDVLNKEEAKAFLQLEINSSDANTAISKLFGDMSKKSLQDLKELQNAAEEAFETLKNSGKLPVESLKAIEDKLKHNKDLIYSLSPVFKQLRADFKTLGSKDTSLEDKEKAFNGISQNIQKATQNLVLFGDVLNSLGNDSLLQIGETLNSIGNQAANLASTLKGFGVSDKLSLGVGLGVGVLTSVLNHFSQARQRQAEFDAQQRVLQLEHEKKLNDLAHQRLLKMEQFSNVFVSNKMGRHLEQLNSYRENVKKLTGEAEKLQNINVFSHVKNKKGWRWRGAYSGYHYWQEAVYKPFQHVYGKLVDDAGNLREDIIEQLNANDKAFGHVALFDSLYGPKFKEGNAEFIKNLQEFVKKQKEIRLELEKYVQESFGDLGNNFADNIVSAVEKGTKAFDSFGNTVANVMKNLLKQMLVTDRIKKMFDDFNSSIADIYAKNKGMDNAVIFEQVKNKTIDFVNRTLKPEIEKGEIIIKSAFDELEKQGVKMYDENSIQQGKTKGFQSMSQDTGNELNAKFTLGLELDRVRNISLEKIQTLTQEINANFKFLQDNSAKQLRHLQGIEANTYMLHNIDKEISGMKGILSDIQLKGLKMK